LPTIFANPAPVKAFKEVGGGGYTSEAGVSQNETCESSGKNSACLTYFAPFSTARNSGKFKSFKSKDRPAGWFSFNNQKSSINNFFIQSIP
jgi:hypothetical protein